ncbi:cytochrome c3 family protein [candidate division KSB1 bacterium]|nr:cytochrome c3 family protein [candidate division KSB1 bacterium]
MHTCLTQSGIIVLLLMILVLPVSADEITSSDCMECHGDKELVKETESGQEISLYVDLDKFSNSMHGGFECIECHDNITELPHEENVKHPNCATCHEDVSDEYFKSVHGKDLLAGDEDAPYCWDCHSSHYVYAADDTMSWINPKKMPITCARCHSDPQIVKRHHIPIPNPSEAYEQSIHYKTILMNHGTKGASCADCHSAHNLQLPTNPESKINRLNIPKTCGTCHEKIAAEYMESIHGQGLLSGATDAPVCTDCHAEHQIKAVTDPSSSVFSTVISKTTCPQCHEVARINSKYGMPGGQVKSYADSFHGLASRAGSVVTANCASCHGVHDILPSSDPKSTVNKKNLAKTCGECHPGVTSKVAIGSVHISPASPSDKIIYYIKYIYYILIVSVIGGMLLHNGLDFIKKARQKMSGHHENGINSGRVFVRLTVNERIQHFLLMTSFTALVITGFALVYPEAWWVAPFAKWEGAFAIRGLVHRFAAGIMVGLALYHLFYLIATKRGRNHLIDFLPTLKDVQDVIQMFKYYLGISKAKPQFARYNYMEKAEYWALIWGTVVMSLTGFILWFENYALRFFPKWVTDVSAVIHFYEAVLATMAIIVWHFYYQFFDPHVYPMNTTCLTGKMSEEAMKDEHPIEYDKLNRGENHESKW